MSHDGPIEVPVLARLWHEDDVWNVSAFDLPIVAYGEGLEEARANFEEAVQGHFQALAELKRLDAVIQSLGGLAEEQGFYEQRMKPHVLVETFVYRPLAERVAA
jgi:predicted RNase H-like HicB family nuclease